MNKISTPVCVAVCLMLMAFISATAVAGTLEATVERQTVIDGESVLLYIEGTDLNEQPDVSVLSRDFEVLDSRRSNSTVIEQGVRKSSFMLRFELLPKHLGQVEIPAFTAGGETTQPIRIDVVENGTAGVEPRDKVFAEITFDNENPYVQSQVIMSLHILDDGSLATLDPQPPVIPDIQVERLPLDGQRIEKRGDVEYRVHTWRYALFPQRNGEIEIPPMKIPGSVKDPGYGGNLILRNIATRRISVRTKATSLNVKPKPAVSTADWWLPVEKLQLTHKWSEDIKTSVVGEPLTLTVALTTQGATSNQLPEILPPNIAGLKIYPDVPELVSQPNEDGLISRRTEKWSVIPLREGVLKLPAVTVKWWDTEADVERTVTLAEQELLVAAAEADTTVNNVASSPVKVSPAADGAGSVGAAPDQEIVAPEIAATNTAEAGNAELTEGTVSPLDVLPARSRFWKLVALVATAGWLGTLLLWWFRSRQRPGNKVARAKATPDSSQRLRELKALGNTGNASTFREALMVWAQSHWPQRTPVSPAEIGQRLGTPALQDQLRLLDSSLYGKDSLDVPLSEIYATLSAALEQNSNKLAEHHNPLPEL